ncbi:MAG TPA: flagellar basal body P-ring formation chaperone FlgA [Thermoguttaceae bacterium]|nr:flagellar basal body P-ring formation chaperone FlgA [Thermoguttaceae bacterium]
MPLTSSARTYAITLAAIGIALFGPAAARAAELQLRPECRCSGPVVTLGDVADVLAADSAEAEVLAAVELFPTPPSGTKRFLQVRQLQDLLLARGVDLLEHPISGASQVAVLRADEEPGTAEGEALPASAVEKVQRRVSEAVMRYLQAYVSVAEPWTVDVKLSAPQARWVASSENEISVDGGVPPWLGMQRFEVTVLSPDGPVRFDVDAEVTLVSQRVVAVRSLPRDAIIRATDVRLEPGGAIEAGFHSIDEVVDRQTTRALPKDKVVDRGSIQEPLLVRRGEVITVYARSAGIRVRSTAKAREEGSLGDLIQVESLLDRATYFACVSGIQEVEVYARPAQADRIGAAALHGSAPPPDPDPRVLHLEFLNPEP